MPWFKVDDGFYDHPKVLDLDLAAVGLWTLAGAYCARHLTDGRVTFKQIRAIGGTRRQAEKLVEAGLWKADDAPPASRTYTFHGWTEYQPTRREVTAKRDEARERMAAARARKRGAAADETAPDNARRTPGGASSDDRRTTAERSRDSRRTLGDAPPTRNGDRGEVPVATAENSTTSDNAEMFARTNRERSREVRQSDQRERSHYPDPTRPDPTHIEGEVVTNGDVVGSTTPTAPSLDDLAAAHAATADAARDDGGDGRGGDTATPDAWSSAADPRCREHADLDRAEVPPCHACAAAREWFEEKVAAAWRAHRAAINDCDICDDRGLVDTVDTTGSPVVVRCDHTTRPNPRPAATLTAHQPTSDPDTRRQLLDALKRPGGPF